MKNKFKIFIFMLMLVFVLPLSASATENHAPVYVGEKTEIELEKGKPFLFTRDEISHWFKDEDGDSLSYWIKVNGSRYLEIEDRCVYYPEANEEVMFTFKANDGLCDSEEIDLPMVSLTRFVRTQESLKSLTIYRSDSSLATSNAVAGETTVLLKSNDAFENGIAFNPNKFEYDLNTSISSDDPIFDTESSLSIFAGSDNAEYIYVIYGDNNTRKIKCSDSVPGRVKNLLSAGKNEFEIKVGDSGPTYTFNVNVIPTLKKLSTEGFSYWKENFDGKQKEYEVIVPKTLKTLKFSAECFSEGSIKYNNLDESEVDISDTELTEIPITVSKDWISNIYTVKLIRKPTNQFKITTIPSDAVVTVIDHLGNELEVDAEGDYNGLFDVSKHTYKVSHSNYETVYGEVPADGGTVTIKLNEKSGSYLDDVNAEWKNFRGSDNNMAIVSTALPTEDVAAKWIKKLGSDYTDAPSVPIIVDNALVVMSGQKLYKLDLDDGKVFDSADMVAKPNWGYTPPTYGGGMIFCPLAGGIIQAFNADTLDSLWVYEDEIGGQSLSPIVYDNNHIYTGFWQQETKEANYVCIDIADENTSEKHEIKKASWIFKQNGGFYWAGGVVIGNAIIVGTDDGQKEGSHGNSNLYAFDKLTGKIISSAILSGAGDQRSSIAYDENRIYFTTKGGYLYSASVDKITGEFSNLKYQYFGKQSTSTPVVYNGRIYFGVGQGFSNGQLAVADADTLKILFEIQMKGYPQGSVLLSTAYENTGYLYLYLSYNSPPGGITLVKVKKDCKNADDATVTEIYDAAGYSQYCISSLICDKNGSIYYKNDSGALFAIGELSYQNVIDQINEIGTVTKDSEGKVLAAREAYNALSSTDQAKVNNYSKLTAAEEVLDELLNGSVNDVMELISSIGKVSLNSKKKINEARTAYDRLTAEEKQRVTNYKDLTTAEKTYKNLVNEAVENVENLIKSIGTVTIDSKTSISKARTAYDQLSDELQELVQNYDDLQAAEKALAKLSETTATTKKAATTTATTSSTTQKNVVSTKTIDKPDVIQIQEDLKSVDSSMEFEEALKLIKDFYELDESQRLALEDSEAIKTLQDIVAQSVHVDENTGIGADGLPWNIRIVCSTDEIERVYDDVEERLVGADILGLWDITLEDAIDGEHYTPEDTLKLKIPKSLLNSQKEYSRIAIIHYNEVAEIEVLTTNDEGEYLECDVVEFSPYAVVGFMDGAEMDYDESQEKNDRTFTWLIWLVLFIACLIVLTIVLYFRFFKTDEEITDIINEID